VANGWLVALGIFLIIIAILAYTVSLSITLADTTVNLTIPQVVAFCNSGLGQFAQLSPQVVMVCSEYNNFLMGIYGFGLLGIILIIVGAVSDRKKESKEEDDSLEILRERYAKGEITKREFEEKKKDLGYGDEFAEHGTTYGKQPMEDKSTFKYKDEETHSEKVLPKKPKRDLKKSPTLKGIIIGIIAVSIIYGAVWGITFQSFVMTNDAMAPTLNTYDLLRYDYTPFNEIQVNDIIFYSDNDKVWVHKVISVDSSKLQRTLTVRSEENIAPHLIVTEEQYIGKLDSVIEGAGYLTRILTFPIIIIILIATFAIPIVVMKIRG